jgi:diguanylate cyclase (GGDEF)-like protein
VGNPPAASWSTQQLVEFLAVIGSFTDEPTALRGTLELAGEALEAEIGLVLRGTDPVANVGFPGGRVDPDVAAAVVERTATAVIPGLGPCRLLHVEFDDGPGSRLAFARAGNDPYGKEEVALVGGMARMLALTIRNLRLLEAERALREKSERQTREALHDSLTGLPNRALLLDRLEHSLARARRDRSPIALLFLDMDRFKVVNDSLGHSAGDELLVVLAQRVLGCIRADDTAARLGGDEFAVVLERSGVTVAVETATRILDAVRAPFELCGREVFAVASIGIAAVEGADLDAGELLRNADVAMYRAKSSGGGGYAVFEPGMHTDAVVRLELEADLRRAVANGEFFLEFQQIVALASGEVTGFEALVRWQHPTRGRISPDRVIGLAEDTGLIIPLGRWVLEEACRWAVRFRRRAGRDISMSVNVSPRQLQDAGLVSDVTAALDAAGLSAWALVVEITEGVLMRDPTASLAVLARLEKLGARVAVDDFGTGYSSLSYLQRFPVSMLKIDKTFVDGLDRDDGALARAIVRLGHSLGLTITAEGIETARQLDELRGLRCELGQGFLFARPVEGSTAEASLVPPFEGFDGPDQVQAALLTVR